MDASLTFKDTFMEIRNKTRTAGDGMECSVAIEKTAALLKKKENVKSIEKILPKDRVPGRLIQVYPKNIIKQERKSHIRMKHPKFVPYEPYPAAVKPIVPNATSTCIKKTRNNMDINTLIAQMSQMDTNLNEFKPRTRITSSSKPLIEDLKQYPEKVEMQKTIDDLIKKNESLKDQLKQQVQVNKELKTMLVASMGEDLETQVQSLNEDKKHLANALLNSAQHLSTHQEQTEWLAGQCEVWRSKFLASSLMVEELANWKKILSERTETLQQCVKQLLDERCRTRDMMFCTYRNLYSLHEKWLEDLACSEYLGNSKMYNRPIGNLNLSAMQPHSTNIIDLASVNLKLSENVSSTVPKQDVSHLNGLPSDTDGERNAETVMAAPIEIKKVNEEPVSALVHHAYNNSSNVTLPVASCAHCNGKVQLL